MMKHKQEAPLTSKEIRETVDRVFDEIDPVQMAIFRDMTPARKAYLVADMFAAMKAMAIASERHAHPERSDEENYRHAMARWMRASEWEPEIRKKVFGF